MNDCIKSLSECILEILHLRRIYGEQVEIRGVPIIATETNVHQDLVKKVIQCATIDRDNVFFLLLFFFYSLFVIRFLFFVFCCFAAIFYQY